MNIKWSFILHLGFKNAAAAAAKSRQTCPTLCDPIHGSPPDSADPGILQARTLEWVAISFSNAWKWKVKVKLLSCVRLLVTPWTAAHQAPLSTGFSRQEYWSGVPESSSLWLFGETIESSQVYNQEMLYKDKSFNHIIANRLALKRWQDRNGHSRNLLLFSMLWHNALFFIQQ